MNKVNKVIGVLVGLYVFVLLIICSIPYIVFRIPLGELRPWIGATVGFWLMGLIIYFWVIKAWLAPAGQLLSYLEKKEKPSLSLIQEAIKGVYGFPLKIGRAHV